MVLCGITTPFVLCEPYGSERCHSYSTTFDLQSLCHPSGPWVFRRMTRVLPANLGGAFQPDPQPLMYRTSYNAISLMVLSRILCRHWPEFCDLPRIGERRSSSCSLDSAFTLAALGSSLLVQLVVTLRFLNIQSPFSQQDLSDAFDTVRSVTPH